MSRQAALHLITLVSLALLWSGTSLAQRNPKTSSIPFQVHGQVRLAQGGRPAEFILVRLESFGGGIVGEATTDRSGRFNFTGLSPDIYIISVRTPGYREVQQQVDLRTQITDYVQMQLVEADEGKPSVKRAGVIDVSTPKTAIEEFEKGRYALLEANNIRDGILHLENALKIYPKYLEAMLMLGTAYMDNKEWDKAETTLRQVLTLESKTTAAHFALGDLYLRQKKYSEAETYISAGVKLDAKSVQGHYMLGRLYYELGDLAKAGPHVGTALQLNPRFAKGHLLAGNILLHARQAENALVEFEQYLRLEPKGEFSEQTKELVRKLRQALAKG
jgi:Tfp pilus assembly protein PilF